MQNFWLLSFEKKKVLVNVVIFYLLAKLLLCILPSKLLLRFLMCPKKETTQTPNEKSILLISWAFRAISGYHAFFASCLAQAMAAKYLLHRKNISCSITIGIKKNCSFRAHAWLSYNETVVVGALVDLDDYIPLMN